MLPVHHFYSENRYPIINIAGLPSLWYTLTEPSGSIAAPETRHRARAVAATLLLTIALILVPLLQNLRNGVLPPYLVITLVTAACCYALSRTAYYRAGGIIAIIELCAAPTYAILTGYSDGYDFLLSTGRLLLVALLAAYILYSLRVSMVLALLLGAAFLFTPPSIQPNMSSLDLAIEFLLTSTGVFSIFVITRQFDLSERKLAQAALSASDERYRAIVEAQTELVSRWLPDTTLTFVNETYCRYFGKTREELIGKRFSDLMLAEDYYLIAEATAPLTREQPTTTYRRRVDKGTGKVTWLEWTDHAIFNEQGQIIEYQSVGHDVTEQKYSEQELSASEQRYRAIVEIQTELICRWLPDETITFVNEAFCRYFDKPREEIIGASAFASVYPDDLAYVKQMIGKMSRQNPTVTYEHRLRLASGELRWQQWTEYAIYDNAGNIVEYQSVGRDITDLKRAEEAERKQREFAEALANTAALLSSTLNLDEVLDRILDQAAAINPAHSVEIILLEGGEGYVARSRANVSPTDYSEFMAVRFSLQNTRNLREMVETGKPVNIPDVLEYEGWLPTHAARWIRSAVGAPIQISGETIGFLSMNSDTPGVFSEYHAARLQAFANQAAIAIRNARLYDEVLLYANELEGLVRQRTHELELAHQRQSAILNGTAEGIFYTEDGLIQFANLAFCKLTGYAPEEFIGQTYPIFYSGTNPEALADKVAVIRDAVKGEGVWRGEFRLRRKDGTTFEAGMTISLIGHRDSQPFRSVTVVRDISREKALHLQRSNLVAYASHELRTPITNMKTRLYLLRRRPEALEDHLVILDEVTERMRRLVEDLLDISRLEHGLIPLRRSEISLQDVISSVVTLQQPEAELKNLELCWTLPDTTIYLSADQERLIQVITNLVTNAINYTRSGGQVKVSLVEQDGQAQIAVEDNGIGIAPENLPYIFQPFYRVVSEVEGTGLGLSIAKEIVQLHGGTLQVRSVPREGSVFTVTLPTRAPAATTPSPTTAD